MVLKKMNILLITAFLIGCCVCACGKEDSITSETLEKNTEEVSSTEETKSAEEEATEQWEKGYNLPVDEQEAVEAENDCIEMMELISDIYGDADKGAASNVVLEDETIFKMQRKIMETGCPVATLVLYSNMGNYENVDNFLNECMDGKSGVVVIYEICDDGGVGRMKFIFDGTDMYIVSTRGVWNDNNTPGTSYISYTRIKEWKYTDKGWFCYELCVPEYPEVTEIVPKIHEAGGLAVLAHPAVYDSYDVMEELLPLGLDGVEVWHPRNHPDDPERLSGFCREHGLIMTGGTDFHGLYTKKLNPLGTCTTGDDQVELMKKRCEKYRKQPPRADKR